MPPTSGEPEAGEGPSPAPPALEVRPLGSDVDAARDDLVRRLPRGTFFHLALWRDFVRAQYGHEPRELGAWRGDQLVGVLPMMLCQGLAGSQSLISMPYAVYGGPVGVDEGVETRLVRRAQELADDLGVSHLELRCVEAPAVELPGTDLYCTFKRDLPTDPAEVLAGMPKKARAEARKARKRHGLELAEGDWYVDDLYRLFLNNKHALGSPAPPPEHFGRLMGMAPEDVYVHLVSKGGTPLSAVMSFVFRDTLIAFYAGTADGADRSYSASNFMYAALQEWAAEEGFRSFDFCRSRRDSGAFRFKVHQGFEPTPLCYRYHLVRAKQIPAFNPSNPRTAVLRNAWAKLPRWVVRRLGRRLYRYLP